MPFNPQFPFLAILESPDVSKLTNDHIFHSPYWPPVPTKIPSDFPKFEGKSKEDPQAHVMTYHLWCSSNSYVNDSICLRLFQRTLTGASAKCYIKFPRATYDEFNSLAMAFLTHFQFPNRYENDSHFLTSLKQDTTTHIFDHIHEWRHWRCLTKFEFPDDLLTQWFTKSFVNKIATNVAMGGCVTEDQDIARAEYLDLVYSQSGTLYEMFLDAPRPSSDPTTSKSPDVPPVDGVIGSVSQTSTKTSSKQKSVSEIGSNNPSKISSNPSKTSEGHVVQSTVADKASKCKKKCKGKAKTDTPKQDPPKSFVDDASK